MKRGILGLYVRITILIFILWMIFGCASPDHLALAQACGLGPECDQHWEDWNKAEDRRAEKERQQEAIYACNDAGGITLTVMRGAHKTIDCVSKDAIIW